MFVTGGYYHGKLVFPREYPFKPPSIYMATPNGRFKCNTRSVKNLPVSTVLCNCNLYEGMKGKGKRIPIHWSIPHISSKPLGEMGELDSPFRPNFFILNPLCMLDRQIGTVNRTMIISLIRICSVFVTQRI